MATGGTYRSIQYQYRLSLSSISSAVPEVCDAIIEALAGEYMPFPSNEQDSHKIAKEYEEMCQFSHCIAAMDQHCSIWNTE